MRRAYFMLSSQDSSVRALKLPSFQFSYLDLSQKFMAGLLVRQEEEQLQYV